MSKDKTVSERTRAALADAKARGVVLGSAGARNLQATLEKRTASADAFAKQQQPVFAELQALGMTHRACSSANTGCCCLANASAEAVRFSKQQQPVFAELQALGMTHRAMADELNRRGIPAARGGEWTHGQVQRMLNRLAGKG